MNQIKSQKKPSRITSIDALRAVTLLGILIVHVQNGFGFHYSVELTGINSVANIFISAFLSKKCNAIFSILFGISFYLILRNPLNSSRKFFWRCFLLALIGLLNKLFYTFDALMWYGICGMCLVTIRNMRPRNIFILFITLKMTTVFLSTLHLGDVLWGSSVHTRYELENSITDIIKYPHAVIDYLRIVFNGGIFTTLSWFVLGYWFAVCGVIENLKTFVTWKFVVIGWILYAITFGCILLVGRNFVTGFMGILSGALTYAATVIYFYYNNHTVRNVFEKLEPYGKLGLTNYSMQGIIGIILMSRSGLSLYQYPLLIVLLFFFCFYLVQAVFSYYWLQHFRYGPMEYLWRVGTEMKIIDLKK